MENVSTSLSKFNDLQLTTSIRDRLRPANAGIIDRSGEYVLLWFQQSFRAFDNPMVEAGIAIANALQKPIFALHYLGDKYPYASQRIHRFMVGASAMIAHGLTERGISIHQHIDRPENRNADLIIEAVSRSCCAVADQHFTFLPAVMPTRLGAKVKQLVLTCDAGRLVPTNTMPHGIKTTPSFRSHHTKLREVWEHPVGDAEVRYGTFHGHLSSPNDRLGDMTEEQIDRLVERCRIDHSLPASVDFPATQEGLQDRMRQLVSEVVPGYAARRNNPSLKHGTARLSPYLRFGMVSVGEVVRQVRSCEAQARDKWKFLDELLTWREWAHYRLAHQPDLFKYAALPEKARATLDDHRSDAREVLAIEDLVHGRTPDPLWNAAQCQWLCTGWMHNNLRMFWSNQLLRWTSSPEEAWAAGCYINDKLSLDGRDPATYASMRYAFGEARPSYRKQPIYGWVFRGTGAALRKREGTEDFLRYWNTVVRPKVNCEDWETRRKDYL